MNYLAYIWEVTFVSKTFVATQSKVLPSFLLELIPTLSFADIFFRCSTKTSFPVKNTWCLTIHSRSRQCNKLLICSFHKPLISFATGNKRFCLEIFLSRNVKKFVRRKIDCDIFSVDASLNSNRILQNFTLNFS